MTEPNDELDDLLAPKLGEESAGLRESLLRRTEFQIHRRVVWRRVGKIVAIPVIFVVGLTTGVALTLKADHGQAKMGPDIVLERLPPDVIAVPVVIPIPVLSTPSSQVVESTEPPTASAAELRAELADDPAEAARLYRLAGDRYLNDRGDYPNAARCYKQFLRKAGDTGLNPEPGDTWLLTSLKNAAFKEKHNVAKTGG